MSIEVYNRRELRVAFFAVAHVTLLLACVAYSGMDSMFAFDHPDSRSIIGATAARVGAAILSEPLRLAWGPGVSRHAPNAIEWLLVASNSILWGIAVSALVRIWRDRS